MKRFGYVRKKVYLCNMKLKNWLLILLASVAAACGGVYWYVNQAEPLTLEPGQVFACTSTKCGFQGYLIPVGDGTKARLYDESDLLATPQEVDLLQVRKKIFVQLGDQRMECQLTPYQDSELIEIPKGEDFTKKNYDVAVFEDITYATASGYWSSYPETLDKDFATIYFDRVGELSEKPLELKMDVYQPLNTYDYPRPLLVMVHGGGFYNGDKGDEEYRVWCDRLARYGYTVASVNYRLGWSALPGEIERAAYRGIQDVHAAVRFLLANQGKYNIDPDRVYLAGCSAGAITALHVAFMHNNTRPEATHEGWFTDEMGNINAVETMPAYHDPLKIRGVCSMWGAVFALDILGSENTAVLSIHDTMDPVVPYTRGIPFSNLTNALKSEVKQNKKNQGWIKQLSNALMDGIKSAYNSIVGSTVETVKNWVLPSVYGSKEIDTYLSAYRSQQKHKLVSTNLSKHTIVRDEETQELDPDMMAMCEREMVQFFSEVMMDREVKLVQDTRDPRVFSLGNADLVKVCRWEVRGGVIVQKMDDTHARLLLFNDEDSGELSVTVEGICHNGLAFKVSRMFKD